jgi:hypothetical protein
VRPITFWLRFLLAGVTSAAAQHTTPVVVNDQVAPDSGAAALVKYRNLPAHGNSIPREIPPPSSPPLASTFFGMTWNTTSHFPPIPFGTMRLWDTGTSWQEIETSDGVFNWRGLDSRLAQASANGKDVLYTFGRVPVWISSVPSQRCGYGLGCAAPPSDVELGDITFKAFVTALVKHSLAATNHIKYYELWNEPDFPNFWTGTTAQLVIMNNDASNIIHALDPNAFTVGPSPTGHNSHHWISAWYAAGGNHDIGGFHTAASISGTLTEADNVRTVMNANGDISKPLWVTEGNWGASQNSSFTDDQKVAFLAQEYLLLWSKDIARYYWYAWDNTRYGTLWDSSYGIHKAGRAYELLYKWLVGSTHSQPCSKAGDATWTCNLTLANGNPAEILWNANTDVLVTVSSIFKTYQTVDDSITTPMANQVVAVGSKPVMVQ